MNYQAIGPFVGMTYKGRQIVDRDIKTSHEKALNKVKYLVTETEGDFEPEHILVSSSDVYEREWKERRNTTGDIACLLSGPAILAAMLAFVGSLAIWFAVTASGCVAAIIATLSGLFFGGVLLCGFTCAVKDAYRVISRGFDSCCNFEKIAGTVWYVGDKALHVSQRSQHHGSYGSTSIFFGSIGTVTLSRDWKRLEVCGRDGRSLASIDAPVGRGMNAAEIHRLLKERVEAAQR